MKKLLYLGLNVHKDAMAVVPAEPERNGEVRSYGPITKPAQLPR